MRYNGATLIVVELKDARGLYYLMNIHNDWEELGYSQIEFKAAEDAMNWGRSWVDKAYQRANPETLGRFPTRSEPDETVLNWLG